MIILVMTVERENLKEIISSNKSLIYSIIHKFKGHDIDDLFQVGCIGLINAYHNYNGEYNTKFTTYAYSYIIGEIYKYMNTNRAIKVSSDKIRLYRNMLKATDYLRQKLLRDPTEEEICMFLEIDMYTLYEVRNAINIDSLDYTYEDNDLYSFIEIDNYSKDDLIDLKNALSCLSPDEQRLIIQRYYYNMSQHEVAKKYATNQVKISREEKKILCKLKEKMN